MEEKNPSAIEDTALFKEFDRIKTKMGYRPTAGDWAQHSEYPLNLIKNRFGDYNSFIRVRVSKIYDQTKPKRPQVKSVIKTLAEKSKIYPDEAAECGIDLEGLIKSFFALEKKLQRAPSLGELCDHASVDYALAQHLIGDYRRFVRICGSAYPTREEIAANVFSFLAAEGNLPDKKKYALTGKYSLRVAFEIFNVETWHGLMTEIELMHSSFTRENIKGRTEPAGKRGVRRMVARNR